MAEWVSGAIVVPQGRGEAAACGRRTLVLGIPLLLGSFEDAVARIRTMIATGRPHHVVLANAHTLNLAHEQSAYRSVLRRAALVLRDGLGVELAALLARRDPAHNFVGTDFVPALLRALGPAELRVFLLGGRDGVATAAGRTLAAQASHVRVVGTASGYGPFEPVLEDIRATRPDVLLVGLGNPLQEQWIDVHHRQLGVPVAIGVGALFDFLAARVPRAPAWVRRLRAEWVFRLAVEPRRLWRRYVLGNPKFLWRVVRDHGGRW